ncbi:MAG: serine/threonine protein kinase [Kofleriaceae bacterium]|nr:serine/threonine protein kinase [Kofleriaceae bacterium]
MASVSFPDVPRFEMLSCLGEGGMGVVYEAYDREYDAKVALKVLRFSDHGERIQKFKQEFRVLQEIRHPNLARFLELMEHDGRWFFTMELITGTHFLDWIRPGVDNEDTTSSEMSELPTERILVEAIQRSDLVAKLSRGNVSTLDKERLLDGFVQLARGLLFLHLANKVHRDIKPSNIIVDEGGRVVVLDFGLSADIGEVQSGELMGTPVYMAPELTELGAAGAASDWYSVGVMLFEALTGQLPVSGSMEEILKSSAMKVAPAPSLVDPAVDEMWDFLCTCLMHYDPDKRPGGKEILSLLGSEQARPLRGQENSTNRLWLGALASWRSYVTPMMVSLFNARVRSLSTGNRVLVKVNSWVSLGARLSTRLCSCPVSATKRSQCHTRLSMV